MEEGEWEPRYIVWEVSENLSHLSTIFLLAVKVRLVYYTEVLMQEIGKAVWSWLFMPLP